VPLVLCHYWIWSFVHNLSFAFQSDEHWFYYMNLIMMHLLSVSLDFLCVTSCEHDKVVSAVNCVPTLIGDKNPEHFFVATQDADLREKLREVLTILICSAYLYFFFFFRKRNQVNPTSDLI